MTTTRPNSVAAPQPPVWLFFISLALASVLSSCAGIHGDGPVNIPDTVDAIEIRGPSIPKAVVTRSEDVAAFRAWFKALRPAPLASYPATNIELFALEKGIASKIGDMSFPLNGGVAVLSNGRMFIGRTPFTSEVQVLEGWSAR